jgi:hypothetical protein
MKISAVARAGLAAGLLTLFHATPGWAAKVVAQGPCTYVSSPVGAVCHAWLDGATVPVIRTFSFNMPKAGKALVQFTGTMTCAAASGSSNVDYSGQIVPASAAAASYQGAGGIRIFMVIPDPGTEPLLAQTVNLASSRLMSFSSGGKKTVKYLLTPAAGAMGDVCGVSAAAFTVTTYP